MSDNNAYTCYAIRRVNPFQGVVQIIESDYGRCLSMDGMNWQIQLLVKDSLKWGSLHRQDFANRYYRYGFWNDQSGLKRLPLAPHLPVHKLNDNSRKLLDIIQKQSQSLPFRLMDKYECWLLDTHEQRPLALLMTSIELPAVDAKIEQRWHCKLTEFASHTVPPDTQLLDKQVNQRAGSRHISQWFKRDKNGAGQNIASENVFSLDEFPQYLVREDWQDGECQQRIKDYIDWISPALLTLQHLHRRQRQEREKKIYIQAASVVRNHRLYPEIINAKLVNAALVQNRIQEANINAL